MNKSKDNPDPKKDVRDLTPGKDAKGGRHHGQHGGHSREVDPSSTTLGRGRHFQQ